MLAGMRAWTASIAGAVVAVGAAALYATGTVAPANGTASSPVDAGLEARLCVPPYGTFKVANWPPACWRPYSDSSPWNRPIRSRPRVDPASRRIVRRLVRAGRPAGIVAGQADTPADFSHPTYYSLPTDPLFELHCYERRWGRRCAIEGKVIRIPDAARPAAGRDHHMTIVDQRTGWEYDLYKVRSKPPHGGTVELRWGGRTRIHGDGLASDATAARFGNLAGIVRAQELEAGKIDHALFMVVRCDSGFFRYPALKTGRPCTALGRSNRDAPPMGARFQLALSDAQIDALPVPSWRKTLFRAMARYGLYVGDTGDLAWGIQGESGSTYTSFGKADPMVAFAKEQGVRGHNGRYHLSIREGVDWSKHLRLLAPCEAAARC